MTFKKIIKLASILLLLLINNCIQSTASLFGPAITVSQTGNIYQAGLSYASNDIIKKKLGKTPIEFAVDMMQDKENNITNSFVESSDQNNNYVSFINAVKKNLR